MNAKEKTAAISTALNILLTLFKFVMFGFTGSLAILAEAWHSFSDIATSFMVFIAVFEPKETDGKAGVGNTPPSEEEGCAAAATERGEGSGDEQRRSQGGTAEQIVSFAIGGLLTVVSALLIYKFFSAVRLPIRNSLVSGLIFLAFALGSYLVYRFETAVGRQVGSVGLIADGMHSKADMMASLIAGFSLILYHLGLDVDRWAAGIIALFILSFAIETLVNAARATWQRKREGDALFSSKTHRIQTALFDRYSWIGLGTLFRSPTFLQAAGLQLRRKRIRLIAVVAVVILAGWWTSTALFTLDITEHAVIERFGRPLEPSAPLGPGGLHFKLPWPVDRAVVENTGEIRQMNVGNEVDENAFALIWTWEHGTEVPFISGDDNYFYPYLVVHYRIGNLSSYLYRYADPDLLLKSIAYNHVTKLFSTKSFYEIVLAYRPKFVVELTARIQAELERLQVGIDIVSIHLKDIHPPISVSQSFEGVIASLQEKEEMINKALGNASDYVLESEGEAFRLVKDAEAYATEVRVRSTGDAGLFLLRIPEDPASQAINRRRLYLDAVQEALSRRDMILYDPRAGTSELWLNFGQAVGGRGFDFEESSF